MIGHIKLDRKIQKWEWYQDSRMVHLFIHLLINANHQDGSWRGNPVKRGQLITGRLKLAAVLSFSEREIRTCLNRLKSTGEISIKTTSQFSIITICKYDTYQDSKNNKDQQSDQQSDQRATNERPTSDQRATTNNNDNNENNEKNDKKGLVPAEFSEFACYDSEELILNNPIEFEKILMNARFKKEEIGKAKEELHNHHLWLASKEMYPKGRAAVFAGFESWLIKSKQWNKLSPKQQNKSGYTSVPTDDAFDAMQ